MFIKPNNIYELSEEELNAIIKKNIEKAKQMKQELKRKEKPELTTIKKLEEGLEVYNDLCKEKCEENEEFDEYKYYYEAIKNIKPNATDKEIEEIIFQNLPTKNNSKYFKIISRIVVEINQEISEYFELLSITTEEDLTGRYEEAYIATEDLKNEIHNYIQLNKKKLLIINKNHQNQKLEQQKNQENKIIFLESKSGKSMPIEDLKNIDIEYYEAFYELYDSIKQGTFKKVKRFTSTNQKINGVAEVRGNKVRIIFARINVDTYIILQLLVKKCDKNAEYKNNIISRFNHYQIQIEEIINKINDENYLKQQEEYTKEFEKVLSKEGKVKCLI